MDSHENFAIECTHRLGCGELGAIFGSLFCPRAIDVDLHLAKPLF
jgi:hypothetical protein